MTHYVRDYVERMEQERRRKFWARMFQRLFWMLIGAGILSVLLQILN